MSSRTLQGFFGLLPSRADWIPARRSPGRDLVAGLIVAVVALPLALAFGVSSGRHNSREHEAVRLGGEDGVRHE